MKQDTGRSYMFAWCTVGTYEVCFCCIFQMLLGPLNYLCVYIGREGGTRGGREGEKGGEGGEGGKEERGGGSKGGRTGGS